MIAVPNQLLESMAGAAERAGIVVPEVTKFAPTIDLSKGIRSISLELGRLLSPRNIFLRNDTVVIVHPESGKISEVSNRMFPTWVEEFCVFFAPGSRRMRDSIAPDDAAQVLVSDIFRDCLRPLVGVSLLRLPVIRRSGNVEWLEPGYDVESAIYTVDLIPYDMTQSLGDAQQFFLETFAHFPWNKKEGEAEGLHNNRSFAVHMAGMVGAYCKYFFPPGTLMPILAYFANKPGTGKTRLGESVQCPVFGKAFGTGAPKDEEKWEVKLETIAQSMQPFAFFDDIGRGLRSNALNRFTSEAGHTGRVFHSNSQMFAVPNVTQVILTANDLALSEDLERRALIAELFLDVDVRERSFPHVMSQKWLTLDSTRKKFLSALCSLVNNWVKQGKPSHPKPIPTYEEWTERVGGIVMAADFSDPLARPEGDVGGAFDEDETKQLLVIAASSYDSNRSVPNTELMALATAHSLLQDVQAKEDPAKSLGRKLQRWRGQLLTDERGRGFQIGRKKKKLGISQEFTFL